MYVVPLHEEINFLFYWKNIYLVTDTSVMAESLHEEMNFLFHWKNIYLVTDTSVMAELTLIPEKNVKTGRGYIKNIPKYKYKIEYR